MPVETATDRASFVDEDEFGDSGVWTKKQGGVSTVSGIFDAEWLAKDVGAGALVESKLPMLQVVEADLPSGAGRGDTWNDGTNTYVVTEIQPDGTGMAMVQFDLQD